MSNLSTKFCEVLNSALEKELKTANSEEEVQKILKCFNELDIERLFSNVMAEAEEYSFTHMKNAMFEDVIRFRAEEQEFLARQEQKWYKAFVASEELYIMTLEAAQGYVDYVQSLDDNVVEPKYWSYTVMCHIHGRALQEYLEIVTLMKNGFADGAYARWRSMYELSVISSFILKYGETTAKEYFEASMTDDRYEWARASKIFPAKKKHITFNDIQKACDLNSDEWKQQYELANIAVHASSQGTFGRLSNIEGCEPIVPVGRSDYGITIPGEHSAISLVQISSMFFLLFHESDTIINLKNMSHWVDVIRETYFKSHDEAFTEDDPLLDDNMLSG